MYLGMIGLIIGMCFVLIEIIKLISRDLKEGKNEERMDGIVEEETHPA